MDEIEYRRIFDKALSILGRRQHGREELRKKLFQKTPDRSIISTVISELERLNLLNDSAFAADYANELKTKGYGAFKIRRSLSMKGISKEIIDGICTAESNSDEEFDRAKEAMNKKLRSLKNEKDPMKKKAKIFRFLASRGFSGDLISKLLRISDFSE